MESSHENSHSEEFPNANNCDKTFNEYPNNTKELLDHSSVSLNTQEKLELSSWGLPEKVLQFYKSKGISRMFQWQLECLTLGGVLDAGNLVYSAPTSAGKTLVAEILISKSVFELQKKVLVILPFVSVVREKMFYFQEMYATSGIHVEGYMGGHSPSICFKQVHVAVCTIEKANSIINKLLEEQSLHNLGLVVVDELHLLGDPYRGYLLELLLTKLKYISSKSDLNIQVLGMSATLPNLKSLANWLNADLYYTDFRPVPLNEKLKCGTTLYDKQFNKLTDLAPVAFEVSDDSENVGQLCLETIANGHSVLIFCPTKVWCENLADKISSLFRKNGCSKSAEFEGTPGWILRRELNLKKINDVIEHLKMSPVGLDKDLHRTIAYGVAFHHAGLTLDERDIIEGSFRQGAIRVLCATSTLSSGVNLPARRVIIRSPMSFGGLMDVLTYRQMVGRAGRMGVDTEGESILICKPNEKAMCQTLMCSSLKPIESCLGHGRLSASLKRALLEIVASGIASNPEEVKKYASCTFLAFSSKHDIEDPLQSCIEFLEENEFIRLQENGTMYVPTPLGKACLASSLPPDEGLSLFRELQRARRCFVLDTDLHIIYQVTPYSVSEQWAKVDWLNVLNILEGLPASMKRVGELVGVEEAFLVRVAKGSINPNAQENRNKLSIHRRFYTSLALQDLVNEVPLSEVAEKYECNKGMLQSLQQSAATYAGMVTEFTKRLGWGSVELIFSQFQERLQFGIQRELCELMRLPLLNAVRARALFNAGFTSLSAIASANITDLENAFFEMVPFQSKKEIAGETTYDKEQRNKLETVWVTGKANLSIREAAQLLITESRNILELELGLEGAQWGKKATDTFLSDKTQRKTINHSLSHEMKLNESDIKSINLKNSDQNLSQNTMIISEKVKYEICKEEPLAVIKSDNLIIENICDKNNVNKSTDAINYKIKYFKSEEVESVKRHNSSSSEIEIVKDMANEKSGERDKKYEKEIKSKEASACVQTNELFIIKQYNNISINEQSVVPQKNTVDYFASSFNFDVIPDYNVSEKRSQESDERNKKFLNENNKVADSVSNESDSDSSVEILFDRSMHSKNLSFSRLSEDMFDISRKGNDSGKKMSTPLPSQEHKNFVERNINQSRLIDSKSPDLFSQSLTFDTQLGKILDFEEHYEKDNPQIINPSVSLNSDDLGFVSDLSPPKLNLNPVQCPEKLELSAKKEEEQFLDKQNIGVTASFFESESQFQMIEKKEEKGETIKRKANSIDSPDIIVDSDESLLENQHISKRIKHNFSEDESFNNSSSKPLNLNDSDDEIMPTPKLDKTHLSNVSKISRLRNSSISTINPSIKNRKTRPRSRLLSQNMAIKASCIDTSKSTNNISKNCLPKLQVPVSERSNKINWNKINIIDVCEMKEEFRFFSEELKNQTFVGLALGCQRKIEEKKNTIGTRILKKRRIDNAKKNSSQCHFKEVALDGIAFYWKGNDVFYMSLDSCNVPLEDKINLLKDLCLKQKIFRVFDTKEQIKMLQRCTSVLLAGSYQDPKVASWLLSENWKEKNFSATALEYLPVSKNLVSLIGSLIGNSSPGLLFKSATLPKTRACLEAFLTYHLIDSQLHLLREKGLEKAFERTEMPVLICLAEMELGGFEMCRNGLLKVKTQLDEVKKNLEEKAYFLAQHKFSISSTASVSKVLFKELGLEGGNIALTKKRKVPATTKQALQELATKTSHPLPEIILQWRKIRSVLSKFVSPLLLISSESSRIFGISQTFTVTGRMSMHEPNLQNIPKNFSLNCGEGDAVSSISLRDIFVASENCILLAADYRQIELRLLAHLSQDSELIKNIRDSSDIFINVAATVYGVSLHEVDDKLRQTAKQTFYGIIYGIGPRALSTQLGIEESDAVRLMEDFKNRYPGVKNFVEQIINECKKKGYVSTFIGRRRYLPAINNSNQTIRLEAERQAVNTTIQGSAADLVKTALVMLKERIDNLVTNEITAHLVLHLHDELIFEVQKDYVDTVAVILKDTMENAMSLTVSTPVKLQTGHSWGQLKNYDL